LPLQHLSYSWLQPQRPPRSILVQRGGRRLEGDVGVHRLAVEPLVGKLEQATIQHPRTIELPPLRALPPPHLEDVREVAAEVEPNPEVDRPGEEVGDGHLLREVTLDDDLAAKVDHVLRIPGVAP